MTNNRKTRREFLRLAGSVGVAAVAAPSVLAACSDDDGGSSATDAETAETTETTETTGASTETTAAPAETTAASSGEAAADLKTLVGITGDDPLAGVAWKIGAVLPLSGGGEQSYGKSMVEAVNLAAEDIAAAGGPKIELVVKDNGTADPAKSVTAINELGAEGIGACVSSIVNSFGAMNEGVGKFKILSLDGGGGTATWNKGVPYFYGTRAVSPDDAWAGIATYLKEAFPGKKTWSAVTWQLDPKLTEADKNASIEKLKGLGLEFSGTYELVPFGGQDYATAIAKLKEANADFVFVGVYGPDPGAFANQAAAAGLGGQLVGFEFTDGGNTASRGAWDKGWLFTQDYFDAEAPSSDLGKFFASNYKAKYGRNPDFYAANYYENVLVFWELARRVKEKGGDPTKGDQLLAELEANPTVVSVYGGSGATAGSYTLDKTSHSVSSRPIGIFEYKDGKVAPKAFFEPGGGNYKTA